MSRRLSAMRNLSQTHVGVYTIISKEKEKENDRERIIKKFKFSQNKTIEANSTEPTQTHKPPHAIPNTRNKKAKELESKSVSMQIQAQNNHYIASKDITRKTNQSSHFNTILSDETEKETQNRLMFIKDKIRYENIYENESSNDNGNGNASNSGIDNGSHDDSNANHNEEIKSNSMNFKAGVKFLPVSNDSSDYSGNSSKQENDNEKVLIQRYDHGRVTFIGINQAKAKKIKRLFFSHPNYDISTRLLDDELTNYHCNRDVNKRFKFIKEVQQDNDQLRKINLSCFLKLSDCAIYNLLSFCYENFDELVFNNNQLIGSKVHLSLNNIFEPVISSFKAKYKHIVQLEAFYFKQKTFNHLKKVYPILDLVLRVKVITKDIDKSYEISYSHLRNGVVYNQKWKFDIKRKQDNNKIWLASEYEVYQHKINRFCYTQSVAFFRYSDIIELRMNLFSNKSIVNPFSIKWKNLVISQSPKGFYEKEIFKCPYDYDNFYACEIENMIHVWRGIQSNTASSSFIMNFKRLHSKHFSFGEIVYDVSKVLFYKIPLTAISEGRIKKNQYINFDIEIVSKHRPLKNEIQTLGLLNSTILSDCIQIRKGTLVVFYLTSLIPE